MILWFLKFSEVSLSSVAELRWPLIRVRFLMIKVILLSAVDLP